MSNWQGWNPRAHGLHSTMIRMCWDLVSIYSNKLKWWWWWLWWWWCNLEFSHWISLSPLTSSNISIKTGLPSPLICGREPYASPPPQSLSWVGCTLGLGITPESLVLTLCFVSCIGYFFFAVIVPTYRENNLRCTAMNWHLTATYSWRQMEGRNPAVYQLTSWEPIGAARNQREFSYLSTQKGCLLLICTDTL